MAFDLSNFDVMEYLWNTIDKDEDGIHLRYNDLDLEQLWWMGFVDTEKIDLERWKALFEPYRQADGSFLIGRDDFLSLETYRFKGEIRMPFDALKINEGKYTNEGLAELIEASIAPSCSYSKEKLKEFFDALKKDYRQPDGLILIKTSAKERIKDLLFNYPSPLRNLELLLDQMIEERGNEVGEMVDQADADAATAQAAIQASKFSATPTTRTETKAMELKSIEKSLKRSKVSAEIEGKPKVELKKIKRSRKGMRG